MAPSPSSRPRLRLFTWTSVVALVAGVALVLVPAFRSSADARLAWSLGMATLASEDLASATAGLMIARGQLPAGWAVAGCLVGIFAGDLLLFLAGRAAGPRLLEWPLLRRAVSPDALRASARWIDERGLRVVLLTRFLPGTRLPTYLAAGAVGTDAAAFTGYFALSALAWTPLVVCAGWLAGNGVSSEWLGGRALAAGAAVLAALALVRVTTALATHRGRRLLVSRWRRLTRWEYWPAWIVYAPVLLTVLRQALKYRGLTVFTAVNPGIPGGGFVGESKFAILQSLRHSPSHLARAVLLRADESLTVKLERVRHLMTQVGTTFPIVLKPDQGQRGSGVVIARDWDELERVVAASALDTIVQEYVPGVEFGVFYARRPDEARGRILSLTEKRPPFLVGDGRRTLEHLILDDARAVGMARFFLRQHAGRLHEVPRDGQRVSLGELGTHSRGALFLDGSLHLTREVEDAFDTIGTETPGFFLGRFDVRSASVDEFRAGRFRIVELNGVTSEPTHIYDPAHGLLHGVRTLQSQWRLAFDIGAANRAAGARVTTPLELVGLMRGYRAQARLHIDAATLGHSRP